MLSSTAAVSTLVCAVVTAFGLTACHSKTVAAGVGDGTSASASPATPATATTASAPSAAGTPEPVATATRPRGPAPLITGFGATDLAWDANHTPDQAFDPGTVYDPDPTLPKINGLTGAKYVTVNHRDGRVLGYQLNLHPGVSLAEALFVVGKEFPPDATVTWTATKDTCVQIEYASVTLGAALSVPEIGDTTGGVLVDVRGLDTGVQPTATFILGGYATAADAPPC